MPRLTVLTTDLEQCHRLFAPLDLLRESDEGLVR